MRYGMLMVQLTEAFNAWELVLSNRFHVGVQVAGFAPESVMMNDNIMELGVPFVTELVCGFVPDAVVVALSSVAVNGVEVDAPAIS